MVALVVMLLESCVGVGHDEGVCYQLAETKARLGFSVIKVVGIDTNAIVKAAGV